LRANYIELNNGMDDQTLRFKLQYTTGCNPNTILAYRCTWTDVDNTAGAGIWRYKDLTCTPTDCADNALLTGTTLSSTTGTCSIFNACGTWVLSKDAASGGTMGLNSGKFQESEWDVEANGAATSTVYYFRIYNAEQDTPVYTQQSSAACLNNNTVGGNVCTYPSLLTDGVTVPTTDDEMRHGNYFSGGSEQNFFFWTDY
jgi:hypothetical protein